MMSKIKGYWHGTETDELGISIDCGFCGSHVGPSKYYRFINDLGAYYESYILICPRCNLPSYFDKAHNIQVPNKQYGNVVEHLPEDIEELYNETRNCIKVNAFTSSVLSSRKLLMNVAVSKGAAEGKSFVHYVEYLDKNHFTPPNSRDWVDHIRRKGNEATHEIPNVNKEDAKELLNFVEMLLRFAYEMPGRMKSNNN